MPVQTINPAIYQTEEKAPSIDTIIQSEHKILDDISSQFSWYAVEGFTIDEQEPPSPVRSIISTLNSKSNSTEHNLVSLASLSSNYSRQRIRISKLEEEAANEESGYDRTKSIEQAQIDAGGWSLVDTFSVGHRIFEPRVFEGGFNRIQKPGINIYHPKKINIEEEDKNYLLQETEEIKNIATRTGLNTRLIDEYDPLYILLNPGNNPWHDGVYVENKVLLNNIQNLSNPETRMAVSHELIHAFFGLTPIVEHTEGLAMLLSFIRHPEAVNANAFRSSGIVPAIAEKLTSVPLSASDCIDLLKESDPSMNNIDTSDFEYVYGYNFAMAFFTYFEDQGAEYAFEKYMQFYGAIKRGILFSSKRGEPDNPDRAAMLIQAGAILPGISDAEVTQEALTLIGIDSDKFKQSLGQVMRDPNSLPKQKSVATELRNHFS